MTRPHFYNAFPTRSSDRRVDDSPSFCPDCGDEWDGEHCPSCCEDGIGVCWHFECRPDFGPHDYWARAAERESARRAAAQFDLTGEQLTFATTQGSKS